jgi:epoxyqueuosine reductase QueG
MEALKAAAAEILASDRNCVTPANAVCDELIGLHFFESPLFGVADAADPMFAVLRKPEIMHPEVLLPAEALPAARRVLSWFLPFTEAVRRANQESMSEPSDSWRHARIEGQDLNLALGDEICRALEADGYSAVQVSKSGSFRMLEPFCSNWSERHVAHIAGLGTFGLSKGLITERGMAGRFGSVVTDAPLPVTARPYKTPFEYCTLCLACVCNCPVDAIDSSKGVAKAKDHAVCDAFLEATKAVQRCGAGERLRYGCGKCQVKVPCESRNPSRL